MLETTPSPIATGHNIPEYTVSEISRAVKQTVEDRFGMVRVRGELSGYKVATSGHAYFSLKDEKALLSGVCWRGTVAKLPFKAEDGLEVSCYGRITTYPGRSNYQIVVERMEVAGEGALLALLEKRKAMLAKEGVFSAERKEPLPFIPEMIGVITSPTGAVIRDILHRLEDRFPRRVLLWPVLVQGEGAAEQIAMAIRGFNALPHAPDLLIVARGGGSIEDLWAFNEEVVVRAIADSSIPVISAVGHETDTTLADFVADRRAPTPTAAAEMAVPVRSELMLGLRQQQMRMQESLLRLLEHRQQHITSLVRGLPKPDQLLEHAMQRLDDWGGRLDNALPQLLDRKSEALARLSAAFQPKLLRRDITAMHERICALADRLDASATRRIQRVEEQLIFQEKMLNAMDYTQVLKRGYALIMDDTGHLVSNKADAFRQKRLRVRFHDGEMGVRTEEPS